MISYNFRVVQTFSCVSDLCVQAEEDKIIRTNDRNLNICANNIKLMDSEGTIKVIYYIACREKNITFSAVTEIHKAL